MDREEMKRHLGAGQGESPAGPGRDDTTMTALSGVSIELGKLSTLMEQMNTRMADLAARQDASEVQARLVTELGRRVESLSEGVQRLLEGEPDEEDKGPPKPWDWASMDAQQRDEALDMLVAWAHEELYYWWPWVQARIPKCWYQHRVMQRSMSTIYAAYQQAYRDTSRRVHHESDFVRILKEHVEDLHTRAGEYNCRGDKKGTHRVLDPVRNDSYGLQEARRWERVDEIFRLDQQAGETGPKEAARIAAEVDRLKAEHGVTAKEFNDKVGQRFHHLHRIAEDTALTSHSRDHAFRELHALNERYGLGKDQDLRLLVLARALELNTAYRASRTSARDRSAVYTALQALVREYGITTEELRGYAQRG